MLKEEKMVINEKNYIRRWSDTGNHIEREGILYESAVDPEWVERTYTETSLSIDDHSEAQLSDYLEALTELGVEV